VSLLQPGTPDPLAPPPAPKPLETPGDVKAKLDRGRKAMLRDAPKRRLCMRFRRGDTYWYIDDKNFLNVQSTVTSASGAGKPPHRIRNKYDFIGPIVDAKVSAATRRIPSYETTPATTDPNAIGGAKLAEKVALYGYDKWRMSIVKEKVVDLAIGGGGVGYALPYFDPNVGPYTEVDGQWVGRGEVKVLVLSGNQVYSEPGCDFEYSKWYAIERARPMDEVREIPGYTAATLSADASTSDIPTDRQTSDNLVMVTEYFERPCPRWPQGRTMVFAGGKPIVDYRRIDPTSEYAWGPYPLVDTDGQILDEPLIHRLVYRHDPDTDTDLGLTWLLVDFQRTVQDCYNKLLEWKNRCLNPQMKAPVNSLIDRPSDEPGSVRYYRWQGPGSPEPEWENVPSGWAEPLFRILNQAVTDMRSVSADEDFNADPNVAAATIGAVNVQAQSRWEKFMTRVEEWDSRVMRHCLLLVARHYTEPRLLSIRGRWGQPQRIPDFLGDDLFGQTDIRVTPGSTQAKSRQQIQQELAWIQANWPGYLTPEVAIAALHNGTAEDLIRSADLDMSRVNGVIQDIIDGTVLDRPEWPQQIQVTDPQTGMPVTQTMMVPTFMPTENDSIPIWKTMFGDWMKTTEFERLAPPMQDMANKVWQAIIGQEARKADQAVQAQQAQAMANGEQNAAKATVKGVPSQPGDGISPSPTP
jgi:hypothetical protein